MDQGARAVPEHPDEGLGKPDQDMGPTLWGCLVLSRLGLQAGVLHEGPCTPTPPRCQQSGVRPVPSPGQW